MIEQVQYTEVEGTNTDHDVIIYALTTCGFCKRAIEYLKDKDVAFKYIYIDKLPINDKKKLKAELKEKYKTSMIFPYLVVDNKEALSGFVKEKWESLLGFN